MSTLIAFKWAVLYENVICTATFFSYLNVVRKWEVKMNCCFYWSWKPSSCWSNETGNDSLSKTITQPHFFFHWLLVKTGLGEEKKKSNQSRPGSSHGHSLEITGKEQVWGKDGNMEDEMEYETVNRRWTQLPFDLPLAVRIQAESLL